MVESKNKNNKSKKKPQEKIIKSVEKSEKKELAEKPDVLEEKERNKKNKELLLFNRWDGESAVVNDPGLAQYINLKNILVPISHGRHAKKQFYKSDLNIVERLLNRMYVAGHRGRKHKIFSGKNIGKSQKLWDVIEKAFEIIEKQTRENPVQVFVRAIENSAPKEEVITHQRGGIMARNPVVVSPQRRIDLALRMLVQGAYENRLNSKISAEESLASEIIKASKNEHCKAILEKERREKEAQGAR